MYCMKPSLECFAVRHEERTTPVPRANGVGPTKRSRRATKPGTAARVGA